MTSQRNVILLSVDTLRSEFEVYSEDIDLDIADSEGEADASHEIEQRLENLGHK